MLANVEVVRLDLRLRVGDRAGDQPMLDRYALFHAEPLHEALDAVGPEDPQQIVFATRPGPAQCGDLTQAVSYSY